MFEYGQNRPNTALEREWQTVQILVRRLIMSHFIMIYIVCKTVVLVYRANVVKILPLLLYKRIDDVENHQSTANA